MRSLALALHTAKAFGLQVLGKSRGVGRRRGDTAKTGKEAHFATFPKKSL